MDKPTTPPRYNSMLEQYSNKLSVEVRSRNADLSVSPNLSLVKMASKELIFEGQRNNTGNQIQSLKFNLSKPEQRQAVEK